MELPARGLSQSLNIVMLLSNPYLPDDRVRQEALALLDAGHRVTILAWDRDGRFPSLEYSEGIQIQRIGIRTGYEQGLKQWGAFIKVWYWFVKRMFVLAPHVVHCHDFDTFLPGVLYKILTRGKRLILDAHENYALMMRATFSDRLGCLVGIMERMFTRFADLVIGSCMANATHYKDLGAREAVVIGNWKDPELYTFSQEELLRKKQELGVAGRLVITYIGSFSKERTILPLIQAIRLHPEYFLILGGAGSQAGEIQAALLGQENMFYPGFINPQEVPILTAISDIIFYGFEPSNPLAPFNAPNKLFECLAAGKVFLGSNIGGELTDVVRSSKCGLLLDSMTTESVSDALYLLSSEKERFPLQLNSAKVGRDIYNWTNAKKKLQDIYGIIQH